MSAQIVMIRRHSTVPPGSFRYLLLIFLLLLAGCATDSELEKKAERYETLMTKGRAYMKRGNARMALPSLVEARTIKEDDVELFSLLGLAYDQLGRSVQAMEALQRAHALRPANGGITNNLGVTMMRLNRLDEAEKMFAAALKDKTFPTPEEIHFNLGLLHKRRGHRRKMTAALERALQVNSVYMPARMELADFYRDLGRTDQEQKHLRMALAIDNDNLALMERLADAYLKTGNRRHAIPVLKRIAALAPGRPVAGRANRKLATLGMNR